MTTTVATALREYGELTRVALCDYLEPREPRRWFYDAAAEYPSRGGRMLRPSLCLAAARAYGAPMTAAVRTAAAIELMHNAFLVHDDIEDESLERRGRPTLQATHGVPLAVNVGDGLLMLGVRALVDGCGHLGASLTVALVDDACRMARETVEGQALELGWRRENVVGLRDRDYLHMVLKKTCWYSTIFPLRAAQLIGTRDPSGLDALIPFGFFLGAAFQIQDDLLNLAGDPARYGKEMTGDIWEGKRTLMLVRLMERATGDERRRLHAFLGGTRDTRSAAEVGWVRERLDAYECLDYARDVAHALAGAAQHEFERGFRNVPESRHKAFLAAMPEWVLSRA